MSSVATTDTQSAADRLTLLLPDEIAATIRAEAFAGLKALPKVGAEVGGFLTRSDRGSSISMVDGFEAVPCEHLYGPSYRLSPADLQVFRQKTRLIQALGNQKIVGLFRSSTREMFEVAPEDIALVREVTAGTMPIFVAKPFPDGLCTLRVFWPENNRNWSQFEEFELRNASVRPAQEQVEGRRMPQAVHSPEPSSLPPLPSNLPLPIPPPTAAVWLRAISTNRKRVLWTVVALLACLALARVASIGVHKDLGPAAPDLSLQAEVQGSSLRLTWNRSLPIVRDAIGAKLQIKDGGASREVDLDSSELSHGVIVYTPASDDVTFRLQVRGHEVEQTTATLRVLGGAKRAIPERADEEQALNMGVTPALPFTPEPQRYLPLQRQPLPTSLPYAKTESSRTTGNFSKIYPPERPIKFAEMRQDRSRGTSVRSNALNAGVPFEQPPSLIPNLKSSLPRIVPDTPLLPMSPQPGKEIESRRNGAQAEKIADSLNPGKVVSSSQIATDVPVPPRPLKQVMPTTKSLGFPAVLSRMTITVQVKIDKSGHVVGARALPSASQNSLYWSNKAVEAAKQWTFEPAKIRGESVAGEHTISFHFAPGG